MVLHDAETEKAFKAPFDGRFPYDGPSASTLIRQGWQISLNAAFCVLHELCRLPHPHQSDVTKERLRELVAEWAAGPEHPIKAPIVGAAFALVEGSSIPWREGVELMTRVADYDGQRAALAIAYFASDCDSPDGDDALNLTVTEIGEQWDAKGV